VHNLFKTSIYYHNNRYITLFEYTEYSVISVRSVYSSLNTRSFRHQLQTSHRLCVLGIFWCFVDTIRYRLMNCYENIVCKTQNTNKLTLMSASTTGVIGLLQTGNRYMTLNYKYMILKTIDCKKYT